MTQREPDIKDSSKKDTTKNSRQKIFYGWIVCGVCTLLLFVTMGTASNGLSIFMPHIMKEFGLTNAQVSALVTFRTATAFVAMLLIARYYEHLGFRLGTGIAGLCCAVAYAIYSLSTGYAGLCIGAGMAGISYGLGSMIPVSILMNRWFVKHRTLAISICSAGTGAATIILPPILTGITLRFSLRTAFLFTAVYALLFALLIFLLIREDPSEMGLEALGRREKLHEYSQQKRGRAEPGWISRTLSRKGWILLGSASVMMGALANAGFVNLTVLYTGEGFRPMTVAFFLSLTGILLVIFKIVFGEATDRLGGLRTTAIFTGILFIGYGICCLAFLGSTPLLMADAVFLGIGYPIATIGIPVWTGDLVSQDNYADVVRKLQLSYAAGAMLFSLLPGILADLLGGYIPVYILFTSLIVVSFFCVFQGYRGVRR